MRTLEHPMQSQDNGKEQYAIRMPLETVGSCLVIVEPHRSVTRKYVTVTGREVGDILAFQGNRDRPMRLRSESKHAITNS